GPGPGSAGPRAGRPVRPAPVLRARPLARIPAGGEAAEDAAVARELAVVVGEPFPDAERGEVRRPQRADLPLVGGEIGDAVEADLAGRPRPRAGPFDTVVKVLRFARRPDVDHAGRAPGAARIDAHTGIAVRHPLLRVDQLPDLILV